MMIIINIKKKNIATRQQIIEIIPSYRDLAIQCWGRLGAVLVCFLLFFSSLSSI